MVNYHHHTSFSNLYTPFKDSHVSYEDYAKRAVALGQNVLTSVEHGWQGNYMRAWETAQQYGLKFVFGAEAYWVKDRTQPDRTNAHIILLAKNQEGMYELNEMLSEANETGFYAVPRVDMELLRKLHPENVMVTSACVSFWGKVDKQTDQVLWHYASDEFHQDDSPITGMALDLFEHFGGSFFLEVQAHNTKWQKIVNQKCLDLHYRHHIPMIAGLDSHYLYPEQKQERKYLREESGVKSFDEDHEMSDNVYEDYPSEEQLMERFLQQGVLSASEICEAIENTNVLLAFEDISFDTTRKIPPYDPKLTQEERNRLYEERVWDGWNAYKTSVPPERWGEYEEAIRYETNIVTSTNTSDYFLINSKMLELGQKYGGFLTPTGRGSAGSFLTNMFLKMTTLDRLSLPVKLYPERFVTADRLMSSLPDIDMNVSDPEPFVRAQEEILGKGHVYPFIAYGTLKTKSAFKMYARANNVDPGVANEVSKQIGFYEKALAHAEDDDERALIQMEDYVDAEFLPLVEASKTYCGIVVSKSQAPCGYLLYAGNIRREIGIMRVTSKQTKKTVFCTVIDGYTADAFGYVKNDILTVAVIKVNALTMKKANLPQYSSTQMIDLTKDDRSTWEVFAKGITQGINQCQSEETTKKLMEYKPKSLMDLSAFVAAIRPGFKSQVQKFINREKFQYGVPSFDDILKNDSSESAWMLYQENEMTCMNMAGFTMNETYPIIKAISKKKLKVIMSAKERFLEGFSKQILSTANIEPDAAKAQAEMVWKVIEDSSMYSFNASHAVSVALDALYGAYLKSHFPLEYYTTLLADYAEKGKKDKLAQIREEMQKFYGIQIKPCRFRQDNRQYGFEKSTRTILNVLYSIKGISSAVAQILYEKRNAEYSCFVDLLYDLEFTSKITRAQVKTLISVGYFEEFGSTGKLLDVFAEFCNENTGFKKTLCESSQIKRMDALRDLEMMCPERTLDWKKQVLLEYEYLGSPISRFQEGKMAYVVLSMEIKYSPKLKLYSVVTGKIGAVKIRKNIFLEQPIHEGDILYVKQYRNKPVYQYVNGKQKKKDGQFELWVEQYEKVENIA